MLLPSHKGTSHCCFIPKCLWSCSHDCPYSISLYVLSINFYSSNPDITLVQGLMGEFWLPRFFLNMIQHVFPPFPSYTLSLFLFLSFNSTSLKNSDSIIFLKARNQGLPRCSEECSPYPCGLGLYHLRFYMFYSSRESLLFFSAYFVSGTLPGALYTIIPLPTHNKPARQMSPSFVNKKKEGQRH